MICKILGHKVALFKARRNRWGTVIHQLRCIRCGRYRL